MDFCFGAKSQGHFSLLPFCKLFRLHFRRWIPRFFEFRLITQRYPLNPPVFSNVKFLYTIDDLVKSPESGHCDKRSDEAIPSKKEIATPFWLAMTCKEI